MRKSILSIFVTLSMLLTLIPSVFAADNASAAYVITPDKTTVEQGDIVTFSFGMDKVELAHSFTAKIKYDPTKLVYMSSERGPLYNYDYTAATGKTLTHSDKGHAIGATLSFNNDEYHDVTNTVFFTAKFMVAADVAPGSYNDYITVSEFKAYREKTVYNLKGSVPTLTVESGNPSYPLLVTADKTTAKMGEDVTYTISAKDTISLSGIQMLLDYDPELLEFKEGTLLEGDTSEVDADGIVWAVSEPQDVEGTIATLTFTTLKNGTANITAEATSGPVAVKASFPSVVIISDVNIKVAPDKESAAANDTLVYTVTLSDDVSVTALQVDLDFSGLDISECNATIGSSLESVEAYSNEVKFDGKVAKIAFANNELVDIQAGTLAEFSFKLGSDIGSAYTPEVAENVVTYVTDGTGFTADIDIVPLKPTPVNALLGAVPNVTTAQAGDVITYTVSLDKPITTKGIEAHLFVDPKYVDGDIDVKKLSDNESFSVNYNAAKNDISAVGVDMGGAEVTLSGNLFAFTFKTKADKNVVFAPAFTEIVTPAGLTVSGVVAPVSIFVESSATVNISSSTEYALPGSTVVYTIDLKDAKALKILNIDVNYDPEIYTEATVNAADASPLTAEVSKSTRKINVLYKGESAFAGDKDGLVTIEFKVADDPKPGSDNVTVEVASDRDTELTVNNNAKTSIVSNYGHIVLNTSADYMFYDEFLNVAVTAEDAAELTNLSFELAFDNAMFSRVSKPVVNEGAEYYTVEDNRIRYVYTGDALGTDKAEVMGGVRLYPYGDVSGYTEIKVVDVVSSTPVDSVKATKKVYVYSKEQTRQIIAVRDAINEIGEVTADNFLQKEIKAVTARALYDNLDPVQKPKLAEELNVLEAAEEAIAGYKAAAAAVDELIDAIGEVTAENFLEKGDAIKAAEDAYDNLTNAQKACVTKYEDLKKARELYDGFFAALKNFKVTLAATEDGYTATVVNQKSAADDPEVVIAVYDKDDVLVSLTAGKASSASIAAAADTANTTAEVYVWSSFDNMVPYTDVEIVK